MVQKIIDFLIVNAVYIAPGVLIAALVLSESTRAAAAFLLRLLARLLFLVAVIALVYDGTRTLAGGSGFVVTSLGEHWQAILPSSLEALKQAVIRRLGSGAWEVGPARLLVLPTWVVFGGLGLVLAWIGRKRQRINLYINN